jgi:hypothetical protein
MCPEQGLWPHVHQKEGTAMLGAQPAAPTRPVTPTPQRRARCLAAASLAAAAFVLVSGAATAAAPAANTAIPVGTTGPPPGGVPGVTVPTIGWSNAGDGYQQAYAAVPYDYAHPRGKTFRLKLVRLPAADPAHRIGSLFINFGGLGDDLA